jgi:4-amino-4-deoxy-L-arabinose transferase-like glycosyltransferase
LQAFNEGIDAQQARWMLERGDWITIGWWGNPEFDHAIGLPWLMALSMHWFGEAEWAVRLPSMLASWLAAVLTWRLGSRLSPTGGILGAAILAVLPFWMQASKLGEPAVLFTALGLAVIWTLFKAEEIPARRVLWGALAGLLLNATFLLQGTMVLLLIVALLPYLIWNRKRHYHLTNRGLYWGLGLGTIPTVIWLGLCAARYGRSPIQQVLQLPLGNLKGIFIGSLAQPLTGTASVFYYIWQIPVITFPWSVLALIGAVLVWRNPLLLRKSLWLGYPVVYLGLISLTSQHSSYGALPLYPFLAMLAGLGLNYLGRLFCSPRPSHFRIAQGFGWGLGVMAVLLLSAGGALVVTPGELITADVKLFGWLAIALGTGWLAPWMITMNRSWLSRNGRARPEVGALWQLGWLLGPGLAIAAFFLTGLWGNYSPDIKTALQTPPIAPVLEEQAIHFIQPQQDREGILLSFYTPHWGERYSNWQDIPSGDYAWGDSRSLPLPNDSYQIVGDVDRWQLVKAP